MNSFERVLAALHGTPQTRPPFTLTLSLYGAKLTGCALADYYRHPERYAEGQMAVTELCAPDIIFSPFALPLEAEAFGSELKFLPCNPPNVRKPAGAFPLDTSPDVNSHPSLIYLRQSVRLLRKIFSEETPICGILTAPVDLPAIIMGVDSWIEALVLKPELARKILEVTGSHFVSMANALLEDGAAFIALPVMFTHPSLLYKRLIDELILPALTHSFKEVKGPIVFHHGGNPINSTLTDYLALPNVVAFAVDHRDTLAEARSIIGPGRLLLGNLNGPTLARLPPDEILAKVKGILTDRAGDPHFIFATSAADVPWDTPPELVKAIAETITAF
ncbi:MAG: uroporphyrinogen decarboxylase family protein [Desulforhopalus sp.]|nr:uroporphyrinogen decarboxylase family protein [Desulforhopalus sp.]